MYRAVMDCDLFVVQVSEMEVVDISDSSDSSHYSDCEISQEFGVSFTVINEITNVSNTLTRPSIRPYTSQILCF